MKHDYKSTYREIINNIYFISCAEHPREDNHHRDDWADLTGGQHAHTKI